MTTEMLPAPVMALIASARQWLESGDTAATDVAADDLTSYALRHGMVAWAPTHPPLNDDVVRRHMTRALDGVRMLHTLTEALTCAQISVVTLKGPALSQWLYGNPCARRFADLDLLVPEPQRDAAIDVLAQLGFAPRLPRAVGEIVYRGTGAWPMERDGSHGVDLHWEVAGPRFPRVVSTREIFERAHEISLGGRAIRVPCPEHSAALTLAHAAKHVWYALELTFAIAAMARRSDIDWTAVRRVTAIAGAVRGAAAGLALAKDLFHVDVPSPFRTDIELPAVVELCQCARRALALPPGTFPDRRLERRMHRLAFDRAGDRLRYDVRRLLEPTHAEVTWLPLPPSLSALYWPVRLVRLGVLLVRGTLAGGNRRASD